MHFQALLVVSSAITATLAYPFMNKYLTPRDSAYNESIALLAREAFAEGPSSLVFPREASVNYHDVLASREPIDHVAASNQHMALSNHYEELALHNNVYKPVAQLHGNAASSHAHAHNLKVVATHSGKPADRLKYAVAAVTAQNHGNIAKLVGATVKMAHHPEVHHDN